MFCNKCGATLPEDAQFCGKCGTLVHQPAPAEAPVVEPPAYEPPMAYTPEPVAPKKKKNLKPLWLSLVALLCVAALVVGTYFIFFYNSFQCLLNEQMDLTEGDFSDLEEMAPPQAWDKLFEDTHVMIDSVVSDPRYAEACVEAMNEEAQDLNEELGLGANIEQDCAVVCDHPLTKEDMDNLKEGLKDTYKIASSSVEDARLLHVEIEWTGDKDSYTAMSDMHAVKIDGEWYLASYYSYSWNDGEEEKKEIHVSFVAESAAKAAIRQVKSDSGEDDEIENESWN